MTRQAVILVVGRPAMPKSQELTLSRWFLNQLFNTSLPWLVGLFFIGTGFYFITTNTLAEHTRALADLSSEIRSNKVSVAANQERTREQFLADSKATSAGIAELNKQTAVMASTLVGVQKELEKIGNRLDTVAVPVAPRH